MLMKQYLFLILILFEMDEYFAKPSRLAGGIQISIDQCSYQTSLMRNNKHMCGAVIISKTCLLTSADCIYGVPQKELSIRSGSSSRVAGGTIHKVVKIIIHNLFNKNTKDYDLAIIEVDKQFNMKTAKPITLASQSSVLKPGNLVMVTGWGAMRQGSVIFAEKLEKIFVPIIEQNVCISVFGRERYTNRMLCAGFISGGKDICTGDFGGPMVYDNKLVGIASWSDTCGKPGSFGVYTSIAVLRNWIESKCNV